MHFHKLNCFVVVVFGSGVLAAPSVTSTNQPAHRIQFSRTSVQLRMAGGRAPAPQEPTVPASCESQSALAADGGGPVPPYPPPPPSVPSNTQSVLIVDGGGPVPPYPPPPPTPP